MDSSHTHYLIVYGPGMPLQLFLQAEFPRNVGGPAGPHAADHLPSGAGDPHDRFCDAAPEAEVVVETCYLMVYRFLAPVLTALDTVAAVSGRHPELSFVLASEKDAPVGSDFDANLSCFYGGREVAHIGERGYEFQEEWPEVFYPGESDDDDIFPF